MSEFIIKAFSPNKSFNPDYFMGKSYQTFKGEWTPIVHDFFEKIEKVETLVNSFYEDIITPTSTPEKITSKVMHQYIPWT